MIRIEKHDCGVQSCNCILVWNGRKWLDPSHGGKEYKTRKIAEMVVNRLNKNVWLYSQLAYVYEN